MANRTIKTAVPIFLVGIFALILVVATNYDQLRPEFYIVVLLFIIFMFFFGIATGQSLNRPLKQLLKDAEELSKGNFSSRAYLDSKDEFSELGEAFNKIAEQLQNSQEYQANMEKSVGIKVKAKTQEMEETINALEQKVKNRTIELERLIKEMNQLQESIKNKTPESVPTKR